MFVLMCSSQIVHHNMVMFVLFYLFAAESLKLLLFFHSHLVYVDNKKTLYLDLMSSQALKTGLELTNIDTSIWLQSETTGV